MKILGIYNQQNFGINYSTAQSRWDPKVLRTFQNSNLFRQLNEKYPEACVAFSHYNRSNALEGPYEFVTSLVIDLGHGKGQKTTIEAYGPKNKKTSSLIRRTIEALNLSDIDGKDKIDCNAITPKSTSRFSKLKKWLFLE